MDTNQWIVLEERIIGALIIDPNAFEKVSMVLDPDMFEQWEYREIFTTIKSLYSRGIKIDLLTISMELVERKEGLQLVCVNATNKVASTAHLLQWASLLVNRKALKVMRSEAISILDKMKGSNSFALDAIKELTEVAGKGEVLMNRVTEEGGYEFDPNDNSPLPDDMFTIYKDMEVGGDKYAIAGPGMTVVISGIRGSRKTTFARKIAEAALSGEPLMGFHTMRKPGEKVMIFNMEETKNRVKRDGLRMKKVVGSGIYDLKLYGWKKYSVNQRYRRMVTQIKYCKDPIFMVVVDGITDILNNYNDYEEVMTKWNELSAIAEDKGLIFVYLIHPSSNKSSRGHIGSEIENKGDHVWKVTLEGKEGQFSKVLCTKSKEQKVPTIWVQHSWDGQLTEIPGGPGEEGKKRFDV